MSHTIESLAALVGKRVSTSRPATLEEQAFVDGGTWGGSGVVVSASQKDGQLWLEVDWGMEWVITPDTEITVLS